MSEFEILKRREYKYNRKKWIIIQMIAIALVTIIALGSFLIYGRMNQTYYVEYTESSDIDYKVHYKENSFFEGEWIEKDKEYISSLISGILADFSYKLNMNANNIGFDYTYSIDAVLKITDIDSGNDYYSVEETLIPKKKISTVSSSSVSVREQVEIDYVTFNNLASRFIDTYGLKYATSTLIVTLNVEVLSSSDAFENNNENTYSTSLSIPLAEETLSIEYSESVPTTESKVLAYSGAENKQLFYNASIVAMIVDLILIAVLLVFQYRTKNEDITYAAKVRKLFNAYSSYIQRMEGDFDDHGYQTVPIKTFNDMLGIRDTIQSPILMTENRDETMTRFLIPTSTKLLYCYEIKVDNYDEIYSRARDNQVSTDSEELETLVK